MAALKAAAQGKGPTGMTSDNYYLTFIILDFDRQKKMLTFGDFVTEQSALISTPGVFFLSAVTSISEKVQCALSFSFP